MFVDFSLEEVMKTILYDISVLGTGYKHEEHRTGVYRVTLNALKALLSDAKINVYLTAFSRNDDDCIEWLEEYLPQYVSKFIRLEKYKPYKILKYLFNRDYDIFSPYFEIPKQLRINFFSKKYIIIYDLIQVLHKEWVNEIDYKKYNSLLKSLDKRTFALCISNYTKKDLLNWKTKIDKKKVSVIPLGADEKYAKDYTKEEIEKVKWKYNIKTDKYFYSISSLNPRKNFYQVVKGFIEFIEKYSLKDVSLVLSGPHGWGDIFKDIDIEKYKGQIIMTGFAKEEDLPLLYKGAVASVYLSLHEGFGLPVLESLYAKTPVIASNVTSMPEILGEGGTLISPTDIEELIMAYKKMYEGGGDRIAFEQCCSEQKDKYNWNRFKMAILGEVNK